MNGKLKITSWKGSVKSALMQSLLSMLFCVIYTYIILFLTGGEEFIGKAHTYEEINGIRHSFVLVICGIIAALIPIILLRYDSMRYLLAYIPLSIMFYIGLSILIVVFIIGNNFDMIGYALSSVPIGSGGGTLVALIINTFNNKRGLMHNT